MQKLNAVLKEVAVNGRVSFPFVDSSAVRKESVNILSLDTRSSNGLKRNKIYTIGELVDNIENGNIYKFRSIGRKSVSKILYELCVFQYKQLPKEKRNNYLMEIIKINKI